MAMPNSTTAHVAVASAPAVMRRAATSSSATPNPRHVQPHQQRGGSRHARRQPGEHANADPARRQHVEAEELARHHQNVEEHGEVDAVERAERGKPPQHCGRHQRNMRIQLQHEHRQIRGAERAGDDGIREHPEEPHAQVYTSPMPVDLDAAVIANTRLSADYNVVSLAAPAIAALASPGQFVMVKPARGSDPLLRRPFSIFEICVTRPARAPASRSSTNESASAPGRLYEVEPEARVAVLGPLGRPFEPIAPPAEAWMIAGGVGLAPFLTLSEALREVGTPSTLFYGAQTSVGAVSRRGVRAARRPRGAGNRGRQPGSARLHHATARRCTECASSRTAAPLVRRHSSCTRADLPA